MLAQSFQTKAPFACLVACLAMAAGCSRGALSSARGEIKLAFSAPGGLTLGPVHYAVRSAGNTVILQGDVTVADPNATVSLDLTVPAAVGDTVTLTSIAQPGNLACTGASLPFNVVPNAQTAVALALICGGGGSSSPPPSSVIVTANVTEADHCPNITSLTVAPSRAMLGSTIQVSATATDADAADTVSYAWAPAADFANPSAPSTTFTCTVAGAQTIVLTILDNHAPPCATSIQVPVNCVAVDSSGDFCGDGVVGPSEQCDPPNGVTCDANCRTIPSPTAGLPDTSSAACVSCQFAGSNGGNCFSFETSRTGLGSTLASFGCDGFTGLDRTNCYALENCLSGPACQQAIHDATPDYGEASAGIDFDSALPCLCGNIPLSSCLAQTSWTGVCQAQFVAASGGFGSDVLGRYTSTDYPIGVAANLFGCSIDQPCTTACSIPTVATGSGGAGGQPGTAGQSGTSGAAGTGGGVGTGGVADGGAPSPSSSADCLQCQLAATAADNCSNTSPPGQGSSIANFGCNGFTGADRTNCLALQDCLSSAACQSAIHGATPDYGEAQVGYDSPLPCLCGQISLSACLGGVGWTGVCQAQYIAAAGAAFTQFPGDAVLTNFTSTTSPIAVANNLFTCSIDQACTAACSVGHP